MLFKAPSCHLHVGELLIGGKFISRIGEDFKEKSFKFLGHHIDENLTWVHHMDHVNKKLVSANYALSRSKSLLPRRILKNIYRSLFESHLHFGSIVGGCAKQRYIKVGNTTENLKFNSHTAEAFRDLEYLQINDLISLNQSIFAWNYKTTNSHPLLETCFPLSLTRAPDAQEMMTTISLWLVRFPLWLEVIFSIKIRNYPWDGGLFLL